MSSKSEQLVRDTLDILEDEKYKCKVAFSDILESQFHESDSAFFSFLFKTKKQLHDFLIPGEVNRVFRKLQKWIKTMRKAEHASLYAHFRNCQPVHGWVPSKKKQSKREGEGSQSKVQESDRETCESEKGTIDEVMESPRSRSSSRSSCKSRSSSEDSCRSRCSSRSSCKSRSSSEDSISDDEVREWPVKFKMKWRKILEFIRTQPPKTHKPYKAYTKIHIQKQIRL